MVKVGDKVWVKVLDKYNFRGFVTEIKDNIATINVPAYYGNKNIVFEKDVKFLIRVPETLKELEKIKEEAKYNGCN